MTDAAPEAPWTPVEIANIKLFEAASIYGDIDGVQEALNCGADMETVDDWALPLAAKYDHLDIVRLLLQRGANVHAKNNQALREAATWGCLEIVHALLDAGANADQALKKLKFKCAIKFLREAQQVSKIRTKSARSRGQECNNVDRLSRKCDCHA